MNNKDEIETRVIDVDDESMHLVDRAELGNVVVRRPGAASARLASWLVWAASFVEKHDSMELAYHVVGPRKSVLWLLLLKTRSGLQRVHLEQLECARCRAMLNAANPTLPDLYLGVPSRDSALEHAWAQPVVMCPVCGATLDRPAIWAEVAS